MRTVVLASLMIAATPMPIYAQTPPPSAKAVSPMLVHRANDLIAIMNGAGDPAHMFAPAFLAQVPQAQLRAIAAQITARLGKATGIASFTPSLLRMSFEKGSAGMTLVVGPDGLITGWRITSVDSAAVAQISTLDGVAAALGTLPGKTGFLVADLAHPDAALAKVMPDRPLAMASTFKLIVLAELVRAVDAGERHWDDAVTLDETELPAGGFNHLPAGTTVPLRGLAEAMIRVSDNSAADLLIHALGRERIEAIQAQVGLHDGAANMPFLTTMEMFKLKGIDHGALGQRYLALDSAGRRALLAGAVASAKGSEIGALYADGQPMMIDRIEWFASPADLVRVMIWFDAHRQTVGGAEALRILALNPGIAMPLAERFTYVGYKGGSEPGVISMTLLLRAKDGGVKAISTSWNKEQAAVDESEFVSLINRAADLLAGP